MKCRYCDEPCYGSACITQTEPGILRCRDCPAAYYFNDRGELYCVQFPFWINSISYSYEEFLEGSSSFTQKGHSYARFYCSKTEAGWGGVVLDDLPVPNDLSPSNIVQKFKLYMTFS